MYIAIAVFFIILCVIHFKISSKCARYEAICNGIPGPKLLPIICNFFELSFNPEGIYSRFPELIKKYGRVFRIWLGPSLHLVYLSKPEEIEIILGSTKYIHKAEMYEYFEPWLGSGLLIANGPVWFKKRKLMTSAFHFSNLNNFIPKFNTNIKLLLKKLEEPARGESFNVYDFLTLCTLDIIVESAMNTKIYAQSEKNNRFLKAMDEAELAILKRGFSPWLHSDGFFSKSSIGKMFYESVRLMHDLADSIIKMRKMELSDKKEESSFENKNTDSILQDRYKKNITFLDMLLKYNEDGAGFSDVDLRSDVMMFIMAGHGTTTWCLSWAMYLLSKNPNIQEKMYEEVISVLGPEDRDIEINDLLELKFTERVIKETLRHYPSVPFYGRTVHENVKLPGGYVIPANTDVGILTYCLHMDPEIYENPKEFNPDNFLPEVCAARHPYAYIPFSAGPRNCIGQKFAMLQLKSILSSIIKKFRILPASDAPAPCPVTVLLFKSDTGVHIRLEKRN
nr:PREDICTED: cytochrome P450 4C1-like [Bemisia tabaci]